MQLDREQGYGNIIRSFSTGELRINDALLSNHVIVSTEKIIENWSPANIADLSIADFGDVLGMTPEVIVFGTGPTQIFPPGALITDILRRGIGFEIMATSAACRTFNVLAAERRKVVAALLVR